MKSSIQTKKIMGTQDGSRICETLRFPRLYGDWHAMGWHASSVLQVYHPTPQEWICGPAAPHQTLTVFRVRCAVEWTLGALNTIPDDGTPQEYPQHTWPADLCLAETGKTQKELRRTSKDRFSFLAKNIWDPKDIGDTDAEVVTVITAIPTRSVWRWIPNMYWLRRLSRNSDSD